MRPTFRAALPAPAIALLLACAGSKPGPESEPKPLPLAWRLVPEGTVPGERRQFYLQGEGLEGAEIQAPTGVTVERGTVAEQGRLLSLYIRVDRLAPTGPNPAPADARPGWRRLHVRAGGREEAVELKVLGER